MKYPELVPKWLCKTPVTLTLYGETLTEDGAPEVLTDITALCNYQDGGRAYFDAEQRYIDVSGRAYFNGDIVPEIANITAGKAVIFGEKRTILKGYKRRNPDGTVNHTEVIFK